MGFKLDNISPVATKSLKAKNTQQILNRDINFFGHSFSTKVKENFFTELSVLLKAGITLDKALMLLIDSVKKPANKKLLSTIHNDIVQGKSMSEAISDRKEFNSYEYYSLKIGEESGTLPKVLEQLSVFYDRKNTQRRLVIGALTYPVIILITALLVVVFMLNFVVPMFQDIFKQNKVELPAITRFIISASEFIKAYGWFIILSFASLFILKSIFNNNIKFKVFKDNFILRLPKVGEFIKTVYLSQFTQAITLLTASKVPVVNSIQLVKQMIDFYPLKTVLNKVEDSILKGQSLSESLSQHKFFDSSMIALVKVAEETNQNEFIFERLNKYYNTQVEQRSKLLTTLLEPAIITLVGLIVGVIIVAMYLPMFKLSSVLG